MTIPYEATNPAQLDRLEGASSALRSFAELLDRRLFELEENHLAEGVCGMLDLICDRIDECAGALRAGLLTARAQSAMQPETAAVAGQPETPVHEQRRRFVADQLAEGADLGQIAQALNLRRATVERIAGRLAGGIAESRSPAPGDRVANG